MRVIDNDSQIVTISFRETRKIEFNNTVTWATIKNVNMAKFW